MASGIGRPAGELDLHAALQSYRGPWNARTAAHLLRRAGFGGSFEDVERAHALGMEAAVESLLRPKPTEVEPPDDLYDPIPQVLQLRRDTPDMDRRTAMQAIRKNERASVLSLQRWWLQRMLAAPAPLQEKMALYYHGHFTTAAIQKGVTPPMLFAQNQLFRRYALGNLRDLTWQVSIDPAMLLYLDNAVNARAHPNENYARELMELFTLGLNHYTEDDIRESARAWTGWTVNRRTGEARFVAARHDDGIKRFLGRSGNLTGEDVVATIFAQPQAARWFATSLLNFFVYNDPEPPLVDAVAALLKKNDFNAAPVLGVLLRSNIFYSSRAYRALVKSPVEFAVGTYRALGIANVEDRALRALAQMGQVLFYPPNVAGWPGGANWITSQTMIARQNFLAAVVNSPSASGSPLLAKVPLDARAASRTFIDQLLYGDASAAAFAKLLAYLNGDNTSALGAFSQENYDERVRGAAYLTFAMPAYQLN